MKQLQKKYALTIFAFILFIKFVENTPEWAITENNDKYLIENKLEYTWLEALHECAKRNLSLATIDSAEKNYYFVKLLKNRFGLGVDLWLGATASTAENSSRKFVWTSNGKSFNFANWEDGEPNNLGGDQPCVHTWSKTNNFTWADGQWFLKYGYICEETLFSRFLQDLQKKQLSFKEHLEELLLTNDLNLEFAEKLENLKQIFDNIFN